MPLTDADADGTPLAERLRADLQARSWARSEQARRRVHLLGPDADVFLADMLLRAAGDRRLLLAAELGGQRGDRGTAVLRGLLRDGASGDLGATALQGLVDREGTAASADLAWALTQGPVPLRTVAVHGLAQVGDDGAWEDVLAWLGGQLARKRTVQDVPPTAAVAVTYLLVHADSGSERATRVKELLRHRWERLLPLERDWLLEFWPAAEPGSPGGQEHDAPAMHEWLSNPRGWRLH